MRCAGLLAKLASRGQPVDRGEAGAVVEVYPAASLKCWGLAYRGYKQPRNTQALRALMDDLQAAARWLDPGHHQGLCRSSHDAIDAVVAALTARAAAQGQATRPMTRRKQRLAARARSPCQHPR